MSALDLGNPTFRAYALCSTALAVKMTGIAWHTVLHMIFSGKGNRAPEDLAKGWANPNGKNTKEQLQPYEPTERLRRMMHHDIENNVGFFAVGMLYVLLNAGGAMPLYAYTGSKMIHHFVYLSALPHEARATCWTITSGAFLYMAFKVFMAAF